MHSRVSCLILLLVPHLAPVCASIKFLAARKFNEAKTAKEQLRAQTAQLTEALRQELGPETSVPVIVVAAQDLLGEEAGNMQNEDRVGANLLRQYAQKLSPASLVLSTDGVVPSAPFVAADSLMSNTGADGSADASSMSSMSEERTLERDGDGNAIARITRCKDGMCVRETDVAPAQDNEMRSGSLQSVLASGSDHSSTGSSTSAKAQHAKNIAARKARRKEKHERRAARRAVHHMAQAMREMKKTFGDEGLESILEDLLASERSERRTPTDATEHSVSSSSSTIVEDGRVMQEIKECRDGKCTTSVKEQAIDNSNQLAPEHVTSKQKDQAKDHVEEPAPSKMETPEQDNQNEIILVGAGPGSDGPVVPL